MMHSRMLFRRQNHTYNKDFRCARITGEATSLRAKRKRYGNNYSKGTNIGSGWEQKSIGQRCPFTFTIRMENCRKNQTAGRKDILRLRTSFQRLPGVTLSSSAWRNRRRNARIGRWCMVSGRSGLGALALANTRSAGTPMPWIDDD